MEILYGLIISLFVIASFFLGLYVGKILFSYPSDNKNVIKQIKRDLGIKPEAQILSPSIRQKSEEIIKNFPNDDEL